MRAGHQNTFRYKLCDLCLNKTDFFAIKRLARLMCLHRCFNKFYFDTCDNLDNISVCGKLFPNMQMLFIFPALNDKYGLST